MTTRDQEQEVDDDTQEEGREQWGTGIFTLGNIGGGPVHFLVDTGASVSIIYPETYQRIPARKRPPLNPVDTSITGVSGASIEISGIADITVVFSGLPIPHPMLVADIPLDAILGQDILLNNQGRIDLANLTLKLRGTSIACWVAGEEKLPCRVVVKEATTIPPWSEKLVPVQIQNAGFIAANGLLQPNPGLIETNELLP